MKAQLRQIALLLLASFAVSCANENVEAVRQLNRTINQKAEFEILKERRIADIYKMKDIDGLSPEQEYTINGRLCSEYHNYNIDSAIRYCIRNIAVARKLGNGLLATEQLLHLSYLYTMRGDNISASLLLDSLRAGLPDHLLTNYYTIRLATYNMPDSRRIQSLTKIYSDSIAMASGKNPPPSPDTEQPGELSVKHLYANLHLTDPGSPEYAFAAYHLAKYYEDERLIDSAKHYYALSSIADLRSSNRNSGSLTRLARIYYEEGKYTKAYHYAQSVANDAISGNILSRATSLSNIYSIIVNSYHENKQQTTLYIYFCLGAICCLFVALVVLLIYVYKQVLKLRRMRHELIEANARLSVQNVQLKDYNTVRERYIAHFLEMISMLITKMDVYRNSLRKLAINGKNEELLKRLKSNSMLENELDVLYNEFDSVFLELYPSFVEDFNAMLKPEERMVIRPDEKMNTELRIFALMRLGINNGDEIAQFLHCSRSTVYTYRTKILNQAALSREEFEAALPSFGTSEK